MSSPENRLYELLKAASEDPLSGLDVDVLPTSYHLFTNSAVRIGNCSSDFSPNRSAGIDEFNAEIPIEILCKVELDEPVGYSEAREKVREISSVIAGLLINQPDTDNGICNIQVERAFRGWARINGAPHCIAIIPVTINPL
jgi:hypothetical protein